MQELDMDPTPRGELALKITTLPRDCNSFGDIFGGGSIFDEMFGGRGRPRGPRQGRVGSDLRIKLGLTLEEVAEGSEKKIKVKKHVACEVCDGSGAEGGQSGYDTCSMCHGVGELRQVSRSVFGQFVNVQPCPNCGGELVHREDDNETVVRRRIESYHSQTEPLLQYYDSCGLLYPVEGLGTVTEVRDRVTEILDDLNGGPMCDPNCADTDEDGKQV